MSPVIEKMRWWHIEPVCAIEAAQFPDDAWSREQFWQELAQPTRHYVVVLEDEQVAGYAGAFGLPPDSDVQTIAVREESTGRGLGHLLLDDLMSWARQSGCTHMMLEVRSANGPAISLYERHEFGVISTRRRYYPDGDDALIMRADLRRPS